MQNNPAARADHALLDSLEAVLFDLDDTLFDRHAAQRQILHLIVIQFPDLFSGVNEETAARAFFESEELAAAEFKAGVPIETTRITRFRRFLNSLGLNRDSAQKINAFYLERYTVVATPVAGAVSTVTSLANDYQIGIISNGSPDVQYQKLNSLGIRQLLDCIVLSEEIGIRKPEPGIFLEAVSLLSREPAECIYVGDSYDNDVVGAKNAGLRTCWFNPHGMQRADGDLSPDIESASLGKLGKMLKRASRC